MCVSPARERLLLRSSSGALLTGLTLLLAACANPPRLDGAADASTTIPSAAVPSRTVPSPAAPTRPLVPAASVPLQPVAPAVLAPAADALLSVPPLHALPETPARPLAGRYVRASWASLPAWQDDDMGELWPVFLRNCQGLMRPIAGNLAGPARAAPRLWQPVCAAAADLARRQSAPPNTATIRRFLQTWLHPWRLHQADGAPALNTVTGYYEPLVRGARQPGGPYQWPLYAVPDDLLAIDLTGLYPELAGKRIRGKRDGQRIVPYDSRAALIARGLPALVWVDDPVDAAFLQIQGSGRVQLPDGSTVRMAYGDHNGHPYVSIGRWLAERGQLPLAQASMQNIRAWARRNPQHVPEMLNANPAVVFFREEAVTDPKLGPRGAYGVPLSAQRSIAVDTSFVPLGAPVFLATTWPASKRPLNRLVFAQDTGAAIKGAARADFYWGFGQAAGEQAGRMKQRGQMWVLWPAAAGQPSAR